MRVTSAATEQRRGSFPRLFAATTASGLATWSLPFVLGLAVVDGTMTAATVGVLLAVRTVGFLLALPVAGALADRWSRRGTVVVASLLAAVCVPATWTVAGRPLASAAGVVAMSAALVAGFGQGGCRPALQALVADVVEPERRQRANALISLAVRVVVVAGPAAAALAAPLTGVAGLLVVIAATWLAVAVLVPSAGRGRPVDDARSTGRFVGDLAGGLREARRHPWFLGALASLSLVILTGYSVTAVLLPIVSGETFGGPGVMAASLSGYAAGAGACALLLSRWRPASRGWWALAGLGAYAVAPLALLLAEAGWSVVAAYVVVGAGIELFNVLWFTAVQDQVPASHLARVSALDFVVSYGLAPVGLALVAPLAAGVGVTPVLIACTVVCVVAPAFALLAPGARGFARA